MAIGLPGIHGVDHIGLTVPNMAEAVAFFCNVLGCELVYTAPAFSDDTGTVMYDQLNVHPRSTIKSVTFLRAWNQNLELFEYQSPDQNRVPPRNSDVGGHHIAFYVSNVTEAARYLTERNVQVLGSPVNETDGVDEGVTWLYFMAPWGLQLELIQYPNGKGYERETERRLWDPRQANS